MFYSLIQSQSLVDFLILRSASILITVSNLNNPCPPTSTLNCYLISDQRLLLCFHVIDITENIFGVLILNISRGYLWLLLLSSANSLISWMIKADLYFLSNYKSFIDCIIIKLKYLDHHKNSYKNITCIFFVDEDTWSLMLLWVVSIPHQNINLLETGLYLLVNPSLSCLHKSRVRAAYTVGQRWEGDHADVKIHSISSLLLFWDKERPRRLFPIPLDPQNLQSLIPITPLSDPIFNSLNESLETHGFIWVLELN